MTRTIWLRKPLTKNLTEQTVCDLQRVLDIADVIPLSAIAVYFY